MDFDGEHPTELIPTMIEKWRLGACLVSTIRQSHQGLSVSKRLLSSTYYKIARWLTGLKINPGEADFRLWDQDLLLQIGPYFNKNLSLRLLAAWLPVAKVYIPYEQNLVSQRKSRFTFKKNWELAMAGLVRFSNRPLRLIKWLGLLGILFCIFYGAFVVYAHLVGWALPGWSSIVITVLFLGSLNLFCLGLIASYLSRLTFQNDLPRFIIKRRKYQEK